MGTLVQDVKYGFRMLVKNPGFTAVAVLTLALGIGANSAVFSAIDAILLRPLPFPEGDELMRLEQYNPRARGQGIFVAPARLEDWNRMNSTLQAIAGYYTGDESETSGTLPEKLTRALVSPRFLSVLGISPALGRDFSPEEERFGGPNAVLISDRFWRRRFGGDPNVLGKGLKFGQSTATIIGVMPASFLFPNRDVDLWSAVPMDAPYAQRRESTWFATVGRLKPGVTVAEARADIERIQRQLGKQYPKTDRDLAVEVEPLKETIVGSVRGTLWLLFGSVTLLVLIVCTNIAALLLARATRRQQEIAIRGALGASRSRIVAQLLTEAFLLAAAGAALGLVVAGSASEAFRALAGNLPRMEEIKLDWRIVSYSLACALVATFVCGLVPALRATRRTLSETLAQGSRAHVSGRSPLDWLLVGVQVALAVTLLDGAGLLLRSLQALGRVSPGFDPSHVLTLHISGGWGETADMKALTQRIDRTLDDLRNLPGVEATGTSVTLPGVPASFETELKLTPPPADVERKIVAESRFVSPGYFTTMRIPLLAGEPCRESLGNVGVLVNRSFAQTYLPGSPPMGHHLDSTGVTFMRSGEIVGMVGDAREEGINHAPVPTAYWCVSAPMPDPYYLIRTRGKPMAMAQTIRLRVHEIEPSRAVFDVMSLEDQLGDAFAETRMRTILLTLFALTAVSLACIGLYGTLSYFVSVRRREVGLRLALGAMPGEIVKRFLLQGLRVSILGSVAGLALAAATARLLSGMLYGVSPSDVATGSAVILLVLAVATGSSLLPAFRASRVEPMEVLRDE
ncbi:MAG: ABC transporter permease [Acidobacteria bacterium]|nr:MAG: ABC transporter permease [Acidobacteriota bacterium]